MKVLSDNQLSNVSGAGWLSDLTNDYINFQKFTASCIGGFKCVFMPWTIKSAPVNASPVVVDGAMSLPTEHS